MQHERSSANNIQWEYIVERVLGAVRDCSLAQPVVGPREIDILNHRPEGLGGTCATWHFDKYNL
jgi:hypothetical protein